MKLAETIRNRLKGHRPFFDHIEQVVASEEGLTARCDLAGADRLGCSVMHVELVDDQTPPLAFDKLADLAKRLCGKLSYLLEPLATVELDRRTGSALVRSAVPKTQDGRISYYELVTTAGHHTTMRRYCYDPANRKRSAVEFVLSNDQFELLLDDLVALAGRAS